MGEQRMPGWSDVTAKEPDETAARIDRLLASRINWGAPSMMPTFHELELEEARLP